MRRGTWILAVAAVFGVVFSAGVAEDSFFSRNRSTGSRPPFQFFSRNKEPQEPQETPLPPSAEGRFDANRRNVDSARDALRNLASDGLQRERTAGASPDNRANSLPNYHRELFGTEPPPRNSISAERMPTRSSASQSMPPQFGVAEESQPERMRITPQTSQQRPDAAADRQQPFRAADVDREESLRRLLLEEQQQESKEPPVISVDEFLKSKPQRSSEPSFPGGGTAESPVSNSQRDFSRQSVEPSSQTSEPVPFRRLPLNFEDDEFRSPPPSAAKVGQTPQRMRRKAIDNSSTEFRLEQPATIVPVNAIPMKKFPPAGEPRRPSGLIPAGYNEATEEFTAEPQINALPVAESTEAEAQQDTPPFAVEEKTAPADDTPSSPFDVVPETTARETDPPPVAAGGALQQLSTSTPFELPAGATGPQTPTVILEWVKLGEINVGKECDFELRVRNTSRYAARDVVVDAYFPPLVRLTKAEPQPEENPDHLTWRFPALEPGEQNVIAISMIPSRRGELATRAFVRFTGAAAGVFHVEEPLLNLEITGPQEITLGDPASQIVMVSNPGSGVARDVVVTATVPEGLEHARGKELRLELGSLGPGESRQVRLALAAVDGGKHQVEVEATSANAIRQAAHSTVHVIAPSLQVAIEGPGLRYKGRTARYLLTVTNDGSAPANNVRLTHRVPEGFKFQAAGQSGHYDESRQMVGWFVGQLEPGTTAQYEIDLMANQLGEFTHVATAYNDRGTHATAEVQTAIDGTASLDLEIVDLDDPVEVGGQCAYEIRIRNEGTKSAEAVEIACEIPEGVELISATGPTAHRAENGIVVFKSVPKLAAGESVSFHVHVRATQPGAHRFRCRLASSSIQEPLIYEELTKFYRD